MAIFLSNRYTALFSAFLTGGIVDANKKVCAACGHADDKHYTYGRDPECLGGTLGSPCSCKEYKPVVSEGYAATAAPGAFFLSTWGRLQHKSGAGAVTSRGDVPIVTVSAPDTN